MEKTDVRLGEISKLINGDRGKNYPSQKDILEDGEIPFINAGHLVDNQVVFKDMNYISREKFEKLSSGKVNDGDILYCLRGSLGKKAIVRNFEDGAIASSLVIIRPDKERVSSEYLSLALESSSVKNQLIKANNGSSQPNLSAKSVSEYSIMLHRVDEQKEIIDKINKVKCIVENRKLQLSLLDDLIKSRFVEMFGTLDTNEKEFGFAPLKDLCSKITDGKHGGCESVTGTGCFFVGAREIYDGLIHYDTAPEISHSDFEKDYRRCNVEKGDFLIVNTGATIGKSAIALDERTENTLLQKSVALIKTKKDILLPVFLQYCYMVNPKMYLVESSSAQPNLLLSKIKETVVYVPSVELQNQFATFVQTTDKLKFKVQKSLDETQELFDSLMQEYFE